MRQLLNIQERDAIEEFLCNPAEESFRDLFLCISPQIYRYFRLRGCDRSLGEDLTQDVMFTVFRQSQGLRDRDLFRAWLFRVARNQWLQHVRSQQRRVTTTALDENAGRAACGEEDPLRGMAFAKWLDFLPAAERELIVMRYVEGLEYHEIAAAVKMPLGTVQWKIFEVKRKLARRFGTPSA
jgi:RNA polymerase sigma-70 factor (ECF subfamily)